MLALWLLPGFASAAVYSSSEVPSADWSVRDNNPSGATVDVLYNDDALGYAAHLSGTSTRNSFILGNTSAAGGWDNQTEFFASWRMQMAAAYHVYFRLQTSDGWRWLRYNHSNSSSLANTSGTIIHHGLGSASRDGSWQTFARDLQADLHAAQPDNTLLAVHGMMFRGSGSIADVRLSDSPVTAANIFGPDTAATAEPFTLSAPAADSSTVVTYEWRDSAGEVRASNSSWTHQEASPGTYVYALYLFTDGYPASIDTITVTVRDISVATVYENAEDSSTARWRVYDNNPDGATVQVIDDSTAGSKVILLQGAGRTNGYIIGGTSNTTGWNNQLQTVLNWQQRFAENYTVYARLDTLAGARYLYYDQRTTDRLANTSGTYIHHGLGGESRDGNWQSFSRDLRADLQEAQPGNDIIAVNGFLVRGSGSIDNVSLSATPTITEDSNPLAAFTATPLNGEAPLLVSVDASTSEDDQGIVSYAWDFGNGTTASGSIAEHTFDTAGTFTITLIVTDTSGQVDSTTQQLLVSEPKAAAIPDNLTPMPGSVFEQGSTQTFTWSRVENANSYDFHLFDQTTGAEINFYDLPTADYCDSDACSLETIITLAVSPAHAWRVRSVNAAGNSGWSRSTFAVVPVLTSVPNPPQAISPAVSSDLFTGSSNVFTWQTTDAAASYELSMIDPSGAEVLNSGELNPADICANSRCSSSLLLSIPAADNYQWRVRAGNRVGWSEWTSRVLHVLPTAAAVPGTPVNLSPLPNAALNRGDSVSFSWEAEPEAAKYDFYVYDSSGNDVLQHRGLRPANICSATICQFTIALELPIAENYLWRVSARNTLGIADFSASPFNLVQPVTNEPPSLSLTSQVNDPLQPYSLTFDASASDDDTGIATFSWNFGDGSETEQGPASVVTHDYAAGGEYTVTLTATDTQDGQSSIELAVAVDTDVPPVAQINIDGSSASVNGTAPLNLTLDPSGSTDDRGIIEYYWEFGDGSATQTNTTADVVQHNYATPGDFTLTLRVTDTSNQTHSVSLSVSVFAAGDQPSQSEAARFLTQATFGATTESIAELTSIGYNNWLDTQFSLQGASHLDYVQQYSNGSNREARHEAWWYDVVNGQDQLRQRVAYALSQLFVISDSGYTLSNAQYGVTHYYDQLREHAFGNYRDLLETITLSPVMGIYLSMLQNDKGYTNIGTRPDENFAREVLQLFSIGLHNLELDGSVSSPQTPTFTQAVVENFARVFTGWNYKDAGVWNRQLFTGQDLINPLEPFESHHDDGAKTLLSYADDSGAVPAGLSASEDMRRALDNIANHPNVGPFLSRRLIQQLVTSNPSPSYVRRVATVFNDNGFGTRGDLKAVVRTILLDPEARNGQSQTGYGKLREPVLKLSHLWRAFNITPGAWNTHGELSTYSPALSNLETNTGQAVLRSPSVFNFYSPDHSPAGSIAMSNLVAPEFEIYTDSNILATTARINSQIQRHYSGTSQPSDLNPAYLDYSEELAMANDPDTLLNHLNLVLLSGNMSTELHDIVYEHIDAIDANDTAGLHARVRDAISLIMMAPEYQIQR